jgi:RNA polymerase sigma-70 factor (ECF subfamily)
MIELNELPDDELLRRMIAGDEDAFASLFRRRQGGLYRFALQMTGSTATAEDVTQEAFMTLIRDPKRFDADRGSVSAFLFGIARNHIMRRMQLERAFVAMPEGHEEEFATSMKNRAGGHPSATENPAEILTRTETIDRVREAVLTLPAVYREVVVLCDLQELSYEDVAATIGCAIGTVRSRLHRARNLLISKLRMPTLDKEASAAGLVTAIDEPAMRRAI